MAIHVYLTEQCRRDIKAQHYEQTVDAFRKRIENAQQIAVFDRFPPPYLKKRFERQIRLVAKELFVGEHTVVAFLRLFVRGGSEYQAFGESNYRSLPGFEAMVSELSVENLTEYLASRQDPLPLPPPPPSSVEAEFLHSALNDSRDIYRNYHCCETKLWVDSIARDEFANRLSLFVDPIFETVGAPDTGLAEVRCVKDKRFGILYRSFPDRNMVILFTPFKGDAPKEAVCHAYPDLLASSGIPKDLPLRRARRAYPHDLLLSEDAWFQVQRDKEGNMALSEEEIGVLESARESSGGFPLFINGRAGSGKSTILQYLFSEYLYHHLCQSLAGPPPVFFACNDELLARCSSCVQSLVEALHRQDVENSPPNTSWKERLFATTQEAFRNFHASLLALAPRDSFPRDKLIDYGRFKTWWEDRFSREKSARKLYDPDLSWHVIRTYIKGINPEGYLDPDDYVEIPGKQKSVSPETYRIVFEKVWGRYAEDQKERGFWDHQDLARYVLDLDLIRPEHPVVFCDEAQDFTRIELEVLHRHCLFNARTLGCQDLPKIPFAFAGDPFQTLNPTGFRWEATKAFFVEKFLKRFPGQPRGDLNYRELSYNYRSSCHIVRFCNSLQLVRSIIFDFPEIRPQHSWDDDEDCPNVAYFERGDLEVLGMLKEQSEIRIIVPCEEGGEAEWAEANGLADFVEFDEANVPKNVVSPTRVKGLEFARVVLFGFGGACPPSLRRAISQSSDGALRGDQAIEPQYFLNRLYVAASRPRRRLFIIDSADDIEGFWNQIFGSQETFALRSDQPGEWENAWGQIIRGAIETWEGDREDPFETAEKLAKEGRLRRDRILLRQAAQSYQHAGRVTQTKLCRAEALELEGQYLKAAEIWQEIEHFARSLTAAWKAGQDGYSFIVALAEARPELKNRIHCKFAFHLRSKAGLGEGVALLRDLIEAFTEEGLKEEVLTTAVWENAILSCLERMLRVTEAGTGLWDSGYSRLQELSNQGSLVPPVILGEFAYRSGRLERAFGHWDKVPVEERSKFEHKFLRAKGAALGFPASLEVYSELLGKYREKLDAEEILSLVQREGSDRLSPAHRETIVRARLIAGRIREAVHDFVQVNHLGLLVEIAEVLAKELDKEEVQVVLDRILHILAERERWVDFLEILRSKSLKASSADGSENFDFSSLRRLASRTPLLFEQVYVRFLAYDKRFETAKNDHRTSLAALLRERFQFDLAWKAVVHPILVGAAFERAGLFKDTLPYYEAVAGMETLSHRVRTLARQRWARTKMLQSQRERELGTPTRASKLEKEALDEAKKLGFQNTNDIPEDIPSNLPPVEPESIRADEPTRGTELITESLSEPPAAETQERLSFALNTEFAKCRIRVNSEGSRVNLEHIESFEVASIHVRDRIINVEGRAISPHGHDPLEIPGWNLFVLFASFESGRIELRTPDGANLVLPVSSTPNLRNDKH